MIALHKACSPLLLVGLLFSATEPTLLFLWRAHLLSGR